MAFPLPRVGLINGISFGRLWALLGVRPSLEGQVCYSDTPRIRDPVLSRSTCLDCLQTKRVDCREDMCGPPCGAVSEFIRFREAEAKGVC